MALEANGEEAEFEIEENGEKKIVHIIKYKNMLPRFDRLLEQYRIILKHKENSGINDYRNAIELIGYRDRVNGSITLYLDTRKSLRKVEDKKVEELIKKYFP